MKITSNGPVPTPAATASASAPPASSTAGTKASTVPPDTGSADGALLRTARMQLQQMPEMDMARVAELRGALERGEISFDANRLADLIVRYHGSKG